MPVEQHDAKRRWHFELMYLDHSGVVHVCELKSSSKIKLSNLLDVIREQLLLHVPDGVDVVDCGFKIY